MLEIRIDDAGVIHLSGRFDAAQTETALRTLDAVQSSAVADLAELEYISSAGIGVILKTHVRLAKAGHSLRLVNMSHRIHTVFRYAGLDRLLDIG